MNGRRNRKQPEEEHSTQERGTGVPILKHVTTYFWNLLRFGKLTWVTLPWHVYQPSWLKERKGVIISHCHYWLWIALVEPFPTTCMGKWWSSMPSLDTGPGSDCRKGREDACVYAEGETITRPLLLCHPFAVLCTLLTPASPLISWSMPRGYVAYQVQFLGERC